MKFPSLWGDLEVGSTSPAPTKKEGEEGATAEELAAIEAQKVIDKEAADRAAEGETEAEKATRESEAKSSKEEEEEEGSEYEYTEDDVNKAYGMLEEKGILVLNDTDEFDATPDGIADAVSATVRNKFQAELDNIPPVVQQFYSHITNGGDPEDFVPPVGDINWEEFNSTTDEAKEQALRAFYTLQGYTDDEVEEELEDIKTTGKLDKKADIALNGLVSGTVTIITGRLASGKSTFVHSIILNAIDIKKQSRQTPLLTIDHIDL
jgi:hypothetical protein